MNIEGLGKLLLGGALLLLVLGGILLFLGRLGIERLPGDILWRKGNVTIFAPIGLMILVSIILTVVLNLFFRR